jgi:prepilin-type N-terminal cleavage/methylation domain-containing protein
MKRSGFTLVELLIVIVIIGILASFLIPAINGSIRAARDAECVSDIAANLGAGMTSFKAKLGLEPPSFFVVPEDSDLWDNDWSASNPVAGITDAHRRSARAIIRQLWPDFDFLYGGTTAAPGRLDINGDGDDTDFLVLNGAECLVFFLGGLPERVDTDSDGSLDSWATIGFSNNPQLPFARGGSRTTQFATLYPARLVDIDIQMGNPDEAMPELCDPYPNQQVPYQYLAGYETGSRPNGIDDTFGTADDELIAQPVGLEIAYSLMTNSSGNVYVSGGQVISPGQDGDFGQGGPYNGSNVPSDRATERDNVTSFKKGRLN